MAMQPAAASHFAPLLRLLETANSNASAAIKVTSADPFSYEYPLLVRNSAATKATVGLMLKGTVIDNIMIGGPGMNCRKLAIGDEILKVDGIVADVDNVVDLLVGTDVPDSPVNLLIRKKNGTLEDISIIRMATSRIADRRQMFEYFTHIKDIAVKVSDTRTAELVDATVDLWSKMLLAQEDYNSTVVTNVRQMQLNIEMLLKELVAALEDLFAKARDEKEYFYREETDFYQMISELKQRIIVVEAERDEAIYKHKPCELNIQTLQRRVQALEEQLDKVVFEMSSWSVGVMIDSEGNQRSSALR
ncbi:hypothetical protein GUITHDRAFT_131594 [Guillardia theta CCMP2712]|uniref:PDZ domain-containing protein n=1 Tax=Guillardia theta (strain CCMP2712) TaxID=905079 RepID=L1K463_GUITC|nr:hypothetical protein GUITHDRAFT_131594 [Guillardia theta CCMP2712]EKX55379.1 hypothetical protein GUITHDRAFT_131594 [Guillardia theta CCMP2712]|eukprot:XP_005842359.1 hypothetical protein GUITHDRAFT_131594 [Guillardia theta CCMP2712]